MLQNPHYDVSADKGPKGDKGDTGSQGVKGLKGDKGDKGDASAWGIQGPKEDKGDKGDIGSRGAQGPKGDKGDTGLQGPKGDKGDEGDKGGAGPRGIQGPKGDKGDTGATGSQGPKCDKGDTGPKGATGTQGVEGPKGDKGDTGPQGLKGPQGARGPKGDIGDTGLKGDKGAQGPAGTFTTTNADVSFGNNKLTNLGNPADNHEALNRGYADTRYLRVGQNINLGPNSISRSFTPNAGDHLVNKIFSDRTHTLVAARLQPQNTTIKLTHPIPQSNPPPPPPHNLIAGPYANYILILVDYTLGSQILPGITSTTFLRTTSVFSPFDTNGFVGEFLGAINNTRPKGPRLLYGNYNKRYRIPPIDRMIVFLESTTNDFTVYFNPPIRASSIRLISCSLFNSWYNLINGSVVVMSGGSPVSRDIPDGHYTPITLEKELAKHGYTLTTGLPHEMTIKHNYSNSINFGAVPLGILLGIRGKAVTNTAIPVKWKVPNAYEVYCSLVKTYDNRRAIHLILLNTRLLHYLMNYPQTLWKACTYA